MPFSQSLPSAHFSDDNKQKCTEIYRNYTPRGSMYQQKMDEEELSEESDTGTSIVEVEGLENF